MSDTAHDVIKTPLSALAQARARVCMLSTATDGRRRLRAPASSFIPRAITRIKNQQRCTTYSTKDSKWMPALGTWLWLNAFPSANISCFTLPPLHGTMPPFQWTPEKRSNNTKWCRATLREKALHPAPPRCMRAPATFFSACY